MLEDEHTPIAKTRGPERDRPGRSNIGTGEDFEFSAAELSQTPAFKTEGKSIPAPPIEVWILNFL